MVQVISSRAASLPFKAKVSDFCFSWPALYQKTAKGIVRALEYLSYCADDPCLRRRYFVCPVTGRVISTKAPEDVSSSAHQSSGNDGIS